jgi:NADH-quinone oxidoreductase subunit G
MGSKQVRGKSLYWKGQAVVLAVEDEGVADGCVRLAGGHLLTAHLGTLNGEVSVERL